METQLLWVQSGAVGLRELGFALRERGNDDFSAVFNSLMGDWREDGATFLSEVPSERLRANRQGKRGLDLEIRDKK